MSTKLDPARAADLLANFGRQGVLVPWGARLVTLEYGLTEIEVPFSDAVSQQQDFFHGGVIGTVADSAGGYASLTTCSAPDVVTVEYKINFLKPAAGERILARGKVVRSGRQLIVTQVDVFVENDGGQTPCAVMQQTIMPITPIAKP